MEGGREGEKEADIYRGVLPGALPELLRLIQQINEVPTYCRLFTKRETEAQSKYLVQGHVIKICLSDSRGQTFSITTLPLSYKTTKPRANHPKP